MATVQTIKNAVHKVVSPVVRVALPKAKIRPFGLHPLAWKLYLKSGISVGRIGQTIGNARASAGTHCKTGVYEGADYGACFDLRVHDLPLRQVIQNVAVPLMALGFAVYMRVPGCNGWPLSDVYHVHCIYPACNMTAEVAHQVVDWLAAPSRNGLASHETYTAYQPTTANRAACKALYADHKLVVV